MVTENLLPVWEEVLLNLTQHDLKPSLELALVMRVGFLESIRKNLANNAPATMLGTQNSECHGETSQSHEPKVKEVLYNIWGTETREAAEKVYDRCLKRFGNKHPKAMLA